MKNSIYGVAYLLRKTSMTLGEIRLLEPEQFRQLYEEVSFQESFADYQTALYVGNIMAAIANTVPRKSGKTYGAADFFDIKQPGRTEADAPANKREELEALATRFNIKLPVREIRNL